MDTEFLRNAVAFAMEHLSALDMTTDINTPLPLMRELKLRVSEYRQLVTTGQAQGDLAALAIAAIGATDQRTCTVRLIQDTFTTRASVTFAQYERLNFLPLWPAPFAEQYRAALKARDYDWQVAVLDSRVEFFIITHGTDNYEKHKTKQTRQAGRY